MTDIATAINTIAENKDKSTVCEYCNKLTKTTNGYLGPDGGMKYCCVDCITKIIMNDGEIGDEK